MKIEFTCSHCGKKLAVDAVHAGKSARCRCGAPLTVPSLEFEQPPAEEVEDVTPVVPAAPSPPASPARSRKHDDDMGDAPFERPHQHLEEDLIDMTAMVDIVFFILIFFLVTSLQALQASIEMPKPKPQASSASPKTVQQIEDGGEFVIVRIDGDDKMWVNDSEANTIQVLVSKLRDAKQGRGGNPGPSKMMILAHSEARYATIVNVLDAGTHVGMDDVQLGGDDEEEAP